MLTRAAITGVGVVYLSDFATAGDGADQHDAIIAAYATGKEVRIREGEWFRTTQTLNLPENSRTRCENPQTGGFVLDMAASDGIVFGDGSVVNGLGAKSVTYPSSGIGFNTNYLLGRRGIKPGNNCQLNNVYMSDLAGGLDCTTKTGITLYNINGTNLRSRSGWTPVVHADGASNIVGVGIYGTSCDRFIEMEAGTHDVAFTTGTATNIYPNGYVGQPDASQGAEVYATYSFGLDVHAHSGEGGCYNVTFAGFTGTNCLNFVDCVRSSGSNASDFSHDCSWTNITINSPRTGNPVDLQGYNMTINGLTFGGTKNGSLSRLIYTRLGGASDDNIVITGVTIPDNYYGQPVLQALANGTRFTSANTGTRSTGTTNAFYVYRIEANNCTLDGNFTKQPTYSAAVYYFAAATTGNTRTNNTYTLAGANTPAAAVNYNGTTVTESGNQDGIAA